MIDTTPNGAQLVNVSRMPSHMFVGGRGPGGRGGCQYPGGGAWCQ
jgi:hypothetical protein